jgi:hypothetical protein
MRKPFAIALLLTLCFAFTYIYPLPPAHGEEPPALTEAQQNALQLEIDIFGMCVIDELSPFIKYGFTTELLVSNGFRACQQEADNLMNKMDEVKLTEGEKGAVAEGLFFNMIELVDAARNLEAMERLKEDNQGVQINYTE